MKHLLLTIITLLISLSNQASVYNPKLGHTNKILFDSLTCTTNPFGLTILFDAPKKEFIVTDPSGTPETIYAQGYIREYEKGLHLTLNHLNKGPSVKTVLFHIYLFGRPHKEESKTVEGVIGNFPTFYMGSTPGNSFPVRIPENFHIHMKLSCDISLE